jgi:hypothetical protein
MSKAAESVKRAMKGTRGREPEPVTDRFAQGVARQLERRGIAKVPGLPKSERQPEWYDLAIELERRAEEIEAERQAQRQAEAEAAQPPQTTAGILAVAIGGPSSGYLPLNGAGILRAALEGGQGTVNGGNT